GVARVDDDVALVFAQLGERRLRDGLGALLDRRLVAPDALRRYLERGPRDLTAAVVCRRAADGIRGLVGGVRRGRFDGVRGGGERFLAHGPRRHPHFAMLAVDIERLCADDDGLALQTRQG